MQTSEQINELAAALSKAQGEITGALKDSANPFFKSKYADLAACWDACRTVLSKNGLAVVQAPTTLETVTYLETTLLHTSGQWMRSSFVISPKDDTSQAMGSAITYARRYALCAFVGVAQVDDDGNLASGRPSAAVSEIHKDEIPVDVARPHALAMLAIIAAPAVAGDHNEMQKCLSALDYHERHLSGGDKDDLYKAIYKQMEIPKRNIWKTLVEKGKGAQKQDRLVEAAGRKF